MTPIELQHAVELAIKDAWHFPWWSYLLSLLLGAAGAFIGSYLKAKATNYATKEDFLVILGQLEKQVSATEQIKNEFSLNTWKKQEWSSVRREKLEELVSCAYDLRRIASNDLNTLGFELEKSSHTSMDVESEAILKLQVLSSLYFPEIRLESLRLNLNFRTLQSEINSSNKRAKAMLERGENGALTEEDAKIIGSFQGSNLSDLNHKLPEMYQDFISALNDLTEKSEKMLPEIMGV